MRRRWLCGLLACFVVAAPNLVFAHDLGVQGTTWPIAEPSLLVTILRKVAGIDWKQKSEQLLAQARHRVTHLPQAGLTPARVTKTSWFDPTLVTRQPISAPVKNKQGQWRWRVVYPAGTKINPLKRIRPVTRMLVFDPRSEDQVAFAVAALHAWPNLIRLVATGGNLKKLAGKIKRPIFYTNKRFIKIFHLRHTPSLIGVGAGAHRYDLAVTQFGPADLDPQNVKQVTTGAWYGIASKASSVR